MKHLVQVTALSFVVFASGPLLAQQPPVAPAPGTETTPPATPTGNTTTPATTPAAMTPIGDRPMFIGADALIDLPVGNFSNAAGIGFGALGRYEYVLNPQLNLTGRLGFIYFLTKSNAGFDYKYWTIPILVGVKYTVIPNLYVAGEIGLFNSHFSANIGGPFGNVSSSSTDFGLTLGAGYRLGLIDLRAALQIIDLGNAGDTMSLVASVGYNFWSK